MQCLCCQEPGVSLAHQETLVLLDREATVLNKESTKLDFGAYNNTAEMVKAMITGQSQSFATRGWSQWGRR